MSTLGRKQRERLQREELILDHAFEMVVREGYLGLNLDRLAEAVEYSKGTLYQHFSSKEDILLALTVRTMRTRADLFARGASVTGGSREKLAGVGFADRLFVQLYPGHFGVEHVVKANSIWERASQERQEQLQGQELRCKQVVTQLVEAAVDAGDLDLPRELAPEITFGLWSMAVGAHSILRCPAAAQVETGGPAPDLAMLERNQHRYLDGLGWRPLFADHDWGISLRRLEQEVFPREMLQLPEPL